MLNLTIRKQILDTIFKFINHDDCIVFLFGSFAKGNNRKTSDIDIDIGIVPKKTLKKDILYEIKSSLNEKVDTLRNIDFVDFTDV